MAGPTLKKELGRAWAAFLVTLVRRLKKFPRNNSCFPGSVGTNTENLETTTNERTAGKWWANQRILAVFKDFEKWKFGRLDPNDMRFKIDRPHFNLMAFGLDFGMDKLTMSELADCFDALCTCGIEQHDPENLRKLRKRILKTLDKLDAKTAALKSEKT